MREILVSPNFLLFHMSYIRVTFRKSAKKDFETLRAFTKDAKYDNGRNLNWAVFNKYPQLKIYFDKNKQYKIKNKKALHYFIYEAHRSKQIDMNRALMQHKKCWEKIAPYYFPQLLISPHTGPDSHNDARPTDLLRWNRHRNSRENARGRHLRLRR